MEVALDGVVEVGLAFISNNIALIKRSNMQSKIMNPFCTAKCSSEMVNSKLQCSCGEDTALFDWAWQKNTEAKNINVYKGNKEVLFHPTYSSGTALVRGQHSFQQNFHYYWEIKVVSRLYGTDVMIGVGTSKMTSEDCRFQFCSLLGKSAESWGYSYQGYIQHNNLKRKYGSEYGLGSIIGVHLDMCQGTLEYYFNRKPLGIAFKNLKDKVLYPMVSSTAAQSSIRITCAISKAATLQMSCLNQIMNIPSVYNQYKLIPGLTKLYEKEFFWLKPKPCKEALERKRLAEIEDEVTLSGASKCFSARHKKIKRIYRQLPALLDGHSFAIYRDMVPSTSATPDITCTACNEVIGDSSDSDT
ncbi:unnamed protein product [Ceutorhynchus assimilis]|uniref:B30.2/SPRY domain-containing protein n=1 Tax=Ceutorhynchus assimilis TaxID=467358 RepID=A0A9N9QSF3_9CUCU|nr:unnamed protein product [Ceutorhynchus assimilis]